MKKTHWLAGGVLVFGLTLAGCASGPTISPLTLTKTSKFCTDAAGFQSQAAALQAAGQQGDLNAVRTQAQATLSSLQGLAADVANLPDKANGHLVKDDVATVVKTYQQLVAGLNAANPSDPNALTSALAAVQKSEGQALTQATDRLDGYTKKVCGLTVEATTTTVAGPTTTVPPAGPTAAPTTTAPAAAVTTTAP